MRDRHERLDVEWVAVPKRRLYAVVALLVLAPAALGAAAYVYMRGNPFADGPAEEPAVRAARFDHLEGGVVVVRAGTREVLRASQDTRLGAGDTIQTHSDGQARIWLADGSMLIVRADSVITIADNAATGDGGQSSVRVAVGRGVIRVNTAAQTERTRNTVETRLAHSRLRAQTAATFGVNEDLTEDIRVSSGVVETTARGGQATTIREGEYVALDNDGGVAAREQLLTTPVPAEPPHLAVIKAEGDGGAATLRWSASRGGDGLLFHVDVASSPFFAPEGILLERRDLRLPHLVLDQLRPRPYFWRVRAASASGQLSEWSEPRKFTVVRSAQRKP